MTSSNQTTQFSGTLIFPIVSWLRCSWPSSFKKVPFKFIYTGSHPDNKFQFIVEITEFSLAASRAFHFSDKPVSMSEYRIRRLISDMSSDRPIILDSPSASGAMLRMRFSTVDTSLTVRGSFSKSVGAVCKAANRMIKGALRERTSKECKK